MPEKDPDSQNSGIGGRGAGGAAVDSAGAGADLPLGRSPADDAAAGAAGGAPEGKPAGEGSAQEGGDRGTGEERRGSDQVGAPGKPSRLKRLFRSRTFLVSLGVGVILVSLLLWWHFSRWENTDDAQIDGHLNQLSARIAGHVLSVNFEDNQFVRAGTVLVEIDPADYRVAYQRAKAELAEAVAAADAAGAGVPITAADTRSRVLSARARVDNSQAAIRAAVKQYDAARAKLAEAKAYGVKAQKDLERYTPLVEKDVISRQQYDQVVASAKAATAGVDAADAGMLAAAQQVTEARGGLAQAQAELRAANTAPQQVRVSRSRAESAQAALQRADAALKQAELNLGYTKIVAPVDGITGKKSVEVGQNVSPGQVMAYVVPVSDIWVTANFKETQLQKIRPGQRVTIDVDAYDKSFDGYVESIGAASGARFSLFPPENATGNYVKVVQRVPVRIRLNPGQDPYHLLRPGMSVVPKVRVK